MLRSLVGSEMCIRDSQGGAEDHHRDVLFPDFHVQKAREVVVHHIEISHCLLYTSDAADDLLCVDLGGRRIIKKKKHYHKEQ